MKKILLGLVTVGAAAAALGVTSAPQAGGSVKTTVDNCMNAVAILMASNTASHEVYWQAIAGVVKTHPHWQVVPEYEPMVSQKISFKQFDVKYKSTQGPTTAYCALCGHGATCNELARKVLIAYPDIPNPVVFCGGVPHILENPSSAGAGL